MNKNLTEIKKEKSIVIDRSYFKDQGCGGGNYEEQENSESGDGQEQESESKENKLSEYEKQQIIDKFEKKAKQCKEKKINLEEIKQDIENAQNNQPTYKDIQRYIRQMQEKLSEERKMQAQKDLTQSKSESKDVEENPEHQEQSGESESKAENSSTNEEGTPTNDFTPTEEVSYDESEYRYHVGRKERFNRRF